jgi:mycofactocin system glycosyltransferase
MRYRVDASWQRFSGVVLAGSPLRLFRLTPGGAAVADRIEAGNDVDDSVLTDRLSDAGAIHPTPTIDRRPRFTLDDVTVVTPQLGGVAHDGRLTVDDGSIPPLIGAAVRLDINRGPAGARNAARPLIVTPLVAFLDADVSTPDPAWLARLLWHFDDPRVALVAPRVRGESGSPLDLGDQPARIRAGTRVSYVPGAAIIVRVDALDAVGGFDEGLRFGEDVDLVWRLDDAGWRCRYDPAVAVWHEPRPSWRERLRQHAGYGTSAAPLAMRHPGALSPVHVNGWTAATWALAVFGRPVPALALGAGSSAALVRKLPDVAPRSAIWLAVRGHLLAGQQFASATRRAWWPILLVGAVVSRRCRWLLVLALASDVRAAPTDLAYGWGVWAGMRRLRTWAPIVPRFSSWPGRQPRAASASQVAASTGIQSLKVM